MVFRSFLAYKLAILGISTEFNARINVNWFCFGLEKFKFTTIRSVLVRLGTVAAIFLFVKERSDLVVYTTILSVGNLIAAIAVWPFDYKAFLSHQL